MAFSANKLTEKAQEAVVTAQHLAEERHHTQIEPEHLLAALIAQDGGVVPAVLEKLNVQPRPLLQQVEAAVGTLPRAASPTQVHVSSALLRVLNAAQAEAERLTDDYTSTEHFLLALADDQEKGRAGQILRAAGVTRDRVYQALQQVRGGQRVTSQNPESTYQSLERYGRDLTAAAREGKLDPVIGRDEEVRRVIQVLSRRTKNNPVLIGEPGVGKTAIVEGL